MSPNIDGLDMLHNHHNDQGLSLACGLERCELPPAVLQLNDVQCVYV